MVDLPPMSRRFPLVIVVALCALATISGLVSVAGATPRGDPQERTPDALRAVFARIGIQSVLSDRPYQIPSSNMEPTLHCPKPGVGCLADTEDRILVRPYATGQLPARGDITAFRTPPATFTICGTRGTFVKRIVGLPGDRVEVRLIRGNGWVFIDNKRLREPYIQASRRGAIKSYGPFRVAREHYFVMGDNRSQSCDSRLWGSVLRRNLFGKTIAIYWPPTRARRL